MSPGLERLFVHTNCEPSGPLSQVISVLNSHLPPPCVHGMMGQNKVKWLTNEVVNLINTGIGAAVAMAGYLLLPSL